MRSPIVLMVAVLALVGAGGARAAVTWTTVADVGSGNVIYDASPSQILYGAASGSLAILDRNTRAVTNVPLPAKATVKSAFLSPHGAIVDFTPAGGDGLNEQIDEWRDGSLIGLGSPPMYDLWVRGDYATWSGYTTGTTGFVTPLYERDLSVGTTVTVNGDAGNNSNDIAPNGDVLFWGEALHTGTPSYHIYRYSAGATTQVSQTVSGRGETFPVTDGTNVMYRVESPCCGGPSSLAVADSTGETILGALGDDAQPLADYQPAGGWIAYEALRTNGTTQLVARDPSGTSTTLIPTSGRIIAMNASGQIVATNTSQQTPTLELVQAGATPITLPGPIPDHLAPGGSGSWMTYMSDGRWYEAAGDSLRRLATDAPSTSITTQPQPYTNFTTATLQFTASRSDVTYECQLDAGSWSSCASPAVYTGLADGEHTFSVRATDAAGDTDPNPPVASWTVKTVPPAVTLSAPAPR